MRYVRRIRFGETDPFGVAYFSSYFDFFKEALDEFIRNKGLKPELFYRNPKENYAFPIVYAEGRFFKPLKYDDELEIEISVKLGKSSVTFEFKGFRQDLICEGKIVCVCIDKNWKKRKIPEKILKILKM